MALSLKLLIAVRPLARSSYARADRNCRFVARPTQSRGNQLVKRMMVQLLSQSSRCTFDFVFDFDFKTSALFQLRMHRN